MRLVVVTGVKYRCQAGPDVVDGEIRVDEMRVERGEGDGVVLILLRWQPADELAGVGAEHAHLGIAVIRRPEGDIGPVRRNYRSGPLATGDLVDIERHCLGRVAGVIGKLGVCPGFPFEGADVDGDLRELVERGVPSLEAPLVNQGRFDRDRSGWGRDGLLPAASNTQYGDDGDGGPADCDFHLVFPPGDSVITAAAMDYIISHAFRQGKKPFNLLFFS